MYMGKDLTEVRSLHRPLVPDGVGPGQHEPTFLQAIAIKARAQATPFSGPLPVPGR